MIKKELMIIKNLLLENQYPKQLIETKINKFLQDHKVNNITFKNIKQPKIEPSQINKMKTHLISRQFP